MPFAKYIYIFFQNVQTYNYMNKIVCKTTHNVSSLCVSNLILKYFFVLKMTNMSNIINIFYNYMHAYDRQSHKVIYIITYTPPT